MLVGTHLIFAGIKDRVLGWVPQNNGHPPKSKKTHLFAPMPCSIRIPPLKVTSFLLSYVRLICEQASIYEISSKKNLGVLEVYNCCFSKLTMLPKFGVESGSKADSGLSGVMTNPIRQYEARIQVRLGPKTTEVKLFNKSGNHDLECSCVLTFLFARKLRG